MFRTLARNGTKLMNSIAIGAKTLLFCGENFFEPVEILGFLAKMLGETPHVYY